MVAELDVATAIARRVALTLSAAGVGVTPASIEPLQVVRYRSGEAFAAHHDYHVTEATSVQGEQRAWTALLYGSTLDANDGGATHFPLLNISVWPRAGDALLWSNVNLDGSPNPASLHAGLPPSGDKEKVAINVWVADRPFETHTLERALRLGVRPGPGGSPTPS